MGSKRMAFFFNLNRGLHDKAQVTLAHFWIQHAITPSLERLAKEENIDTEHEVVNMIRRGERLRDHAHDDRFKKKLSDIIHIPGVHYALTKNRVHLESSEEKIMNSVPWWMDRLKETNPNLHKAIAGEPEGMLWFGEVLIDIVALLREQL